MKDVSEIMAALDEAAALRNAENLTYDLRNLARRIRSGEVDKLGFENELAVLAEKYGLKDGSTRS